MEKSDLNNWIPFAVTGIYTLIYLLVFSIQRSQIKKSNDINEKMERYMNQFDLDRLEKYNELIKKSAILEANLLINDSEVVKQAVVEQIRNELTMATKEINENISDEFIELYIFTAMVLKSIEDKEAESIKNRFLPRTKESFDKALLDSLYKKV